MCLDQQFDAPFSDAGKKHSDSKAFRVSINLPLDSRMIAPMSQVPLAACPIGLENEYLGGMREVGAFRFAFSP